MATILLHSPLVDQVAGPRAWRPSSPVESLPLAKSSPLLQETMYVSLLVSRALSHKSRVIQEPGTRPRQEPESTLSQWLPLISKYVITLSVGINVLLRPQHCHSASVGSGIWCQARPYRLLFL